MLIFLIGSGFRQHPLLEPPAAALFGPAAGPYRITLYAGLAKVALAFLLVPRLGLNSKPSCFPAFFVISVRLIVWRGLQEVNHREKLDLEANPA